jgi:hypothetical protein
MYRGEPPPEYWSRAWRPALATPVPNSAQRMERDDVASEMVVANLDDAGARLVVRLACAALGIDADDGGGSEGDGRLLIGGGGAPPSADATTAIGNVEELELKVLGAAGDGPLIERTKKLELEVLGAAGTGTLVGRIAAVELGLGSVVVTETEPFLAAGEVRADKAIAAGLLAPRPTSPTRDAASVLRAVRAFR